MENLEIILTDFNKKDINKLVYDEFNLASLKIISSHFYDRKLKKDLVFSRVKDVEEILSPTGTGNVLIEELQLGIPLKDIMIVFSFNELKGDIVLNFPANEIVNRYEEDGELKIKILIHYLFALKKGFNIPKIVLGYEPATDEDCVLIEIGNDDSNYDQEIRKLLNCSL
ncbi:hypothetical protein NCCP2222_09460 [Sporosarcina sp. NCCP-2222]|uniref:hypothetical protein n=1 Tax=Sporosarcina sp. NCCP-2222 TaxID=2935073 RepID=UPI00208A614E|nr:hypothetical protein [Sporosarcina sp. NCCP-2222]GKV54999.1 hypothetical protein NCCP2222_09460 [Sporosarcina sp. NCCP-2222]